MEFEKQLYFLKTEVIRIDIRLGWNMDSLVLDGYDFGKTVTALKGSPEYEYHIAVKDPALDKLYALNGIQPGQKEQLAEAIAQKINGNKSYSLFRSYLSDHGIPFKSFTQ